MKGDKNEGKNKQELFETIFPSREAILTERKNTITHILIKHFPMQIQIVICGSIEIKKESIS